MFILLTSAKTGREIVMNVERIECVYVDDDGETSVAFTTGVYGVKETYTEVKKRIGEALLCKEEA